MESVNPPPAIESRPRRVSKTVQRFDPTADKVISVNNQPTPQTNVNAKRSFAEPLKISNNYSHHCPLSKIDIPKSQLLDFIKKSKQLDTAVKQELAKLVENDAYLNSIDKNVHSSFSYDICAFPLVEVNPQTTPFISNANVSGSLFLEINFFRRVWKIVHLKPLSVYDNSFTKPEQPATKATRTVFPKVESSPVESARQNLTSFITQSRKSFSVNDHTKFISITSSSESPVSESDGESPVSIAGSISEDTQMVLGMLNWKKDMAKKRFENDELQSTMNEQALQIQALQDKSMELRKMKSGFVAKTKDVKLKLVKGDSSVDTAAEVLKNDELEHLSAKNAQLKRLVRELIKSSITTGGELDKHVFYDLLSETSKWLNLQKELEDKLKGEEAKREDGNGGIEATVKEEKASFFGRLKSITSQYKHYSSDIEALDNLLGNLHTPSSSSSNSIAHLTSLLTPLKALIDKFSKQVSSDLVNRNTSSASISYNKEVVGLRQQASLLKRKNQQLLELEDKVIYSKLLKEMTQKDLDQLTSLSNVISDFSDLAHGKNDLAKEAWLDKFVTKGLEDELTFANEVAREENIDSKKRKFEDMEEHVHLTIDLNSHLNTETKLEDETARVKRVKRAEEFEEEDWPVDHQWSWDGKVEKVSEGPATFPVPFLSHEKARELRLKLAAATTAAVTGNEMTIQDGSVMSSSSSSNNNSSSCLNSSAMITTSNTVNVAPLLEEYDWPKDHPFCA